MPYPPLRRHKVSFKHALDGIIHTVATQPNLRIHVVVSVLVVMAAVFFKVTRLEFAILVVAIMLVICAEMLNTSIEALTDLITTEFKPQAKTAKDVAAGMVLTAAIAAAVIGVLIFLPHIKN